MNYGIQYALCFVAKTRDSLLAFVYRGKLYEKKKKGSQFVPERIFISLFCMWRHKPPQGYRRRSYKKGVTGNYKRAVSSQEEAVSFKCSPARLRIGYVISL